MLVGHNQTSIQKRIENSHTLENYRLGQYRNKIKQYIQSEKGLHSNIKLIKNEQYGVENTYLLKKDAQFLSRSLLVKELKKDIEIYPNDYLQKKKRVDWTRALSDPKLAHCVNNKIWNRYGYGLDFGELGKLGNQSVAKNKLKNITRNFCSMHDATSERLP